MLKATGLTRKTAKRDILDGISFSLEEGSTATVLGPSGSGKTTLLRAIMGLERLDAGELSLGDQCLSDARRHVNPELRDISLVFQEFTLFPNMNVSENLAFGMRESDNREACIDELLELFEISHLHRRRIDRLSGGEQQRVALARALAMRPRVLLMDEPFSNIDNMLRDRLYRRLKTWLNDAGMTTLIATHDHKEAFFFSDAILVMKDGRLIDHNTPKLIYERPANAWVAEFFGECNVLTGAALARLLPQVDLDPVSRYLLRPESIALCEPDAAVSQGRVRECGYYGAHQELLLDLDGELALRLRCSGHHSIVRDEVVGIRLPDDFQPHRLSDPH